MTEMVCESFQYRTWGKMRFIGIDAWRTGEDWEELWARSGEFLPELDRLAAEYAAGILVNSSLMHHNGNEVDTENHFLAGRFFRAGTPVPKGYDHYDIPTEAAACAIYITDNYDGPLGAAYERTRDKMLSDGRHIPYPRQYWHAEIYTEGRPRQGNYRFGYLFAVE